MANGLLDSLSRPLVISLLRRPTTGDAKETNKEEGEGGRGKIAIGNRDCAREIAALQQVIDKQ